jgi:endonuclease YncB( thermonuclease family)
MFGKFLVVVLLALGLGVFYNSFARAQTLTNFTILRIHDGDTIYITFDNVPDVLGKNIGIRLLGLDTPELYDKDICIRNMAIIAKDALATFVTNGKKVELGKLSRDKYFRLDGDFIVDGKSAVEFMLTSKRAQLYSGEGPKPVWKCDLSWFSAPK